MGQEYIGELARILYNTAMLAQSLIKSLLHYDPETGAFLWLKHYWKHRVGKRAEGKNDRNYLRICINNKVYYAHQLAWLYMTGEWPKDEIDHINTIKNDNRWKNLRDATHQVNVQNRQKAKSNNSTGMLGVSRHKKNFRASIGVNRKLYHLGTYPTIQLAGQAYLDAKPQYHPESPVIDENSRHDQ